MIPEIPRWQQYLLLAGAGLAIVTSLSLRSTGDTLSESFVPLFLPAVLWWPQPREHFKRLYWWQMVLFLMGTELGLSVVTQLHIPG